jgi:hypothetical protein
MCATTSVGVVIGFTVTETLTAHRIQDDSYYSALATTLVGEVSYTGEHKL